MRARALKCERAPLSARSVTTGQTRSSLEVHAGTDGNRVTIAISAVGAPANVLDPQASPLAEVVLIAQNVVVDVIDAGDVAIGF